MTIEEITQKKGDFLFTFGGARGTRVLETLSKYCMEHDNTFVECSARKSDFNEGARSVILEIRHWMDYDLSKFEKETVCQTQAD
jgi:hypothetical protein